MENFEQTLYETNQRSKTNAEQIAELKILCKELKEENHAIYSLAHSIELIAQDMTRIKDDVSEVKAGQAAVVVKVDEKIGELRTKLSEVEQRPFQDFIATRLAFKRDVVSNLVRLGVTAAAAILGTLLTVWLIQ